MDEGLLPGDLLPTRRTPCPMEVLYLATVNQEQEVTLRPVCHASLVGAIFALYAAFASMAAAQDLDATLASSRWPGLSLKYPASLLRAVRPEDDPRKDHGVASINDHDFLRARDDSLVVELGGAFNDSDSENADGRIEMWLDWEKDAHPVVTYRAHKSNWAVASGTIDGAAGSAGRRYFYYKVVARCEKGKAQCEEPDTFATAVFTYDAAKHDIYDRLVAAMSKTLTAARPPY